MLAKECARHVDLSLHKSFTPLLCLGRVSLSPFARGWSDLMIDLMINLMISCTDDAGEPHGGGTEKQRHSRGCGLPLCPPAHPNPPLGALSSEPLLRASDMYH